MACVTNFRGYKPTEYFSRCERIFRWSFIFVSGNGLVHEWDPEGGGIALGDWQNADVEKVGRVAADWLDEVVEEEDSDGEGSWM